MAGRKDVRIILADDHPVVLVGLEAMLAQTSGFDVVDVCSDGVSALESIRELKPDIAVLDISMPGLTGIQILEHVADEQLPTKVVFFTRSMKHDEIVAAISKGAWGILRKNIAADCLTKCLTKVTEGDRWFPDDDMNAVEVRDLEQQRKGSEADLRLTAREREIAILVAGGLSNKEIARKIGISEGTVKIHLYNVYQKLGISNRTALAALVQYFSHKNVSSSNRSH